jgi:putative copper resistance protein D
MLYRLSVWLHIVGACLWVGGILFFALVLVPVLRRSRGPESTELVRAVGTRFRTVGWWGMALLAATGFVNLLSRYSMGDLVRADFWLSPFGQALGIKLVLVIAVAVVSLAHDLFGARATTAATRDPSSEDARHLRTLASTLGRLDAILVLAVLYLAVVLVRGW